VREGSAWYALAADGTIAGFATFGSPERSYSLAAGVPRRADVGLFGPYA